MKEHLVATWQMLDRAYPAGFPSEDYWALLEVLVPGMSLRAVASVVSVFLNLDRGLVHNDVFAIDGGNYVVPVEQRERVLQRLRAAGYDEWLASED